ncbi:Glycosyl transferase family 2 [Pseudobutyrivibrio sp. ACV-2]|uniref:glycosyltransferase family 2 protein n=1 Tax=Pseudobutyrivibrio sp. ACV-2 TaxID=1520801 RepID=UPI0008971F55|nr:glycosyltransferase family 2 protein [Pseudobutyrivibrio sp. ACV-2]SEB00633.1 Glycosyl transferase family 2 [Pseudobutyrivibrio sp. ACV-2]
MNIVVLMSTYNGEKYIKQQLDSIEQQSVAKKLSLYIRDDGSKDSTIPIIETYMNDGNSVNIKLERGRNLGVIASFFELIKNAPEADYYAFADQDDVWMPDKIESAVKMLQAEEQKRGVEIPLLYCGDTNLVDGDLNLIVRENKNPRPSFGNALVENICTGCTAVISRALLEKIRENIPNPNNIIMHDWWIYLLAEAYGKTIFDSEPHMNYRQHGHNEWGVKTTKGAVLKYRIKQLFTKRGQIYRQLEELVNCIQEDPSITARHKSQIRQVLGSEHSFIKKIQLANCSEIYRNDSGRDRVYRLSLLLGKL